MKYAVVAVSGTQYRVEENQVITVDHLESQDNKTGTLDQVLLLVDGDKVNVGQPTVKNASVNYTVVKDYRGPKLKVFKFKSKSRYRRTQGFRPNFTDIKITNINF